MLARERNISFEHSSISACHSNDAYLKQYAYKCISACVLE